MWKSHDTEDRSGSNDSASILVIKPSSFGDVIHALPAVSRLKAAWPEARLSWILNPEWAPLLAENPSVDEIIRFPRQDFRGWKGLVDFWRWCGRELAHRRPALAIDFQGLLRSAVLGRATHPQEFVGMSDAREGARWFYKNVAEVPRGPTHAVERYLIAADEALKVLGRDGDGLAVARRTFPLPVGEPLTDIEENFSDRFVLLHPFSRGQGKSLSENQVRFLCQQLSPNAVVLVGRGGETSMGSWPHHCVDLLNRTSLAQLIWLLRRAAAVVTVDSGPSHLAAALGRPMIAIHTWSDPRRVGPDQPDAWVWKNRSLIQVRDLPGLEETFFRRAASGVTDQDLTAIAKLATSLSNSSA